MSSCDPSRPLQVIVGNWVVLVFTFLVVQSVFNKFSGIEVC